MHLKENYITQTNNTSYKGIAGGLSQSPSEKGEILLLAISKQIIYNNK